MGLKAQLSAVVKRDISNCVSGGGGRGGGGGDGVIQPALLFINRSIYKPQPVNKKIQKKESAVWTGTTSGLLCHEKLPN